MSEILICFLDIIKTSLYIEDEKIVRYININLYNFLFYAKEKKQNKNKNKFYYIINKIIKNINTYINKKRYIYENFYLQNIYRNLMKIKKCINNDLYLYNFINDYTKLIHI